MNYLELCQFLVKEAGISLDGPATVVGQTGDFDNVTRWISNAWVRIQADRKQWSWMRRQFRLPLVVGKRRYNYSEAIDITDPDNEFPIVRFDDWFITDGEDRPYSISEANLASRSKAYAYYVGWHRFRQTNYDIGDNTDASPRYITLSPHDELWVYPVPNDDTVSIYGEYRVSPQVLTNDDDVPEGIPNALHEIIVWQALVYYGYEAVATELLQLAGDQIKTLMPLLRRDHLPRFISSGQSLVY